MQNANFSACRLHQDLNVTVHSIGFGPVESCPNAMWTLQAMAECGNGSYYASQNASELASIYESIAENIVSVSYTEQTVLVSGNFTSTLYNDSYILLNYTTGQTAYGLLITTEQEFGNNISSLTFYVPSNSTVVSAFVTSYSGAKWTSQLLLNNSNGEQEIFNLANYGTNYIELGDPFMLYIPPQYIATGNNTATVKTGVSPSNISGGNANDKLLLTLLRDAVGFSGIRASAEGCIWNITFEDGSSEQLRIPGSYTGDETCSYSPAVYNQNDAFQEATYNLLTQLDLDSDGFIDSKIVAENIAIEGSVLKGIPYTTRAEIQLRVWK